MAAKEEWAFSLVVKLPTVLQPSAGTAFLALVPNSSFLLTPILGSSSNGSSDWGPPHHPPLGVLDGESNSWFLSSWDQLLWTTEE